MIHVFVFAVIASILVEARIIPIEKQEPKIVRFKRQYGYSGYGGSGGYGMGGYGGSCVSCGYGLSQPYYGGQGGYGGYNSYSSYGGCGYSGCGSYGGYGGYGYGK